MDTKINLCDYCINHSSIPECMDDVEFGDGYGGDNVIECPNYVEEE